MNYTLRKLNCKALTGAIFSILVALSLSTRAYAAYSMRLIPNFLFDKKAVYVAENISPRASTLTSVTISYDSLADLVYYCNEHGLSTTLAYNTALSVYVGFVSDDAVDAKKFDMTSLYGLLGNSDGKVYVAEKDASGGNTTVNNTYNYNHTVINPSSRGSTRTPTSSTAPSYWEALDTLKAIYSKVDFGVQYLSLVCDWLNFQSKLLIDVVHSLERNVAPALEAVNNNLISTVKNLNAIYDILEYSYSVSLSQLDVENRIYSGVVGIGSRLDSVITNGEVQINTTPLEARLDKLISMYSKVNSVVLDTAAINGGQIKDAVGGELKDVMFWVDTAKVDNTFVSSDGVAYSLNDEKTTVNGLTLRSVNLGSSVPSYIANDSVLYAGVWRKGTDYIISDTYNASTGEYVQRVENFAFSSDSISFDDCCYLERGGNTQLFCITLPVFPVPYDSAFNSNWSSSYRPVPYQAPFWRWENNDSNVDSLLDCFVFYEDRFLIVTSTKGALGNLRNWFCNLSPQFSFLYVPDPSLGWTPSVRMFDPSTIAIPDGSSYISSYNVRITGKYETYDSYTQTADIIAAINNIPPYDDSGLIAAITGMTTPTVTTDLTAVTSRLDLILAELQSSSGSASCEHTYTQHMEQEADCTLPGLMISTCSQCGDSYSEIVDPLGHDWVVSSHVDAVTDPDTGEETSSAYDVYTCSRCERTYEDHTGDGAPDEDYSDTTISKLVVKVFSKLGTFVGKLIGFFVHLLDKALTSVDNVISKFNDYTAQISGFGGSYTTWLTGLWGIIPAELQIALTFSVICMALGAVGKKLLFS